MQEAIAKAYLGHYFTTSGYDKEIVGSYMFKLVEIGFGHYREQRVFATYPNQKTYTQNKFPYDTTVKLGKPVYELIAIPDLYTKPLELLDECKHCHRNPFTGEVMENPKIVWPVRRGIPRLDCIDID